MKEKVERYVDNLFTDIYDTKQLRELKEEVSANLLEKVNDYIANGNNEEEAFKKAVSSLGDMNELIDNLKKVSEVKMRNEIVETSSLDRKHVIGYVIASTVMLFGLLTAGVVYLQMKNLLLTLGTIVPFIMIATPVYVYFGLTQESPVAYGMKGKRAFAYSAATVLALAGIAVAGFVYFTGHMLFMVLGALMPFIIPAAAMFIYLGLTEKSRLKMGPEWQKQWVEYYSNPKEMMVRGNISGALWIFTFAAFLLIGFTLGWKYSWLVFIVAVGSEVLIEAYFAARRNK